jgi:hypothetical protein
MAASSTLAVTAKTMGFSYTLDIDAGGCTRCQLHHQASFLAAKYLLYGNDEECVLFRAQFPTTVGFSVLEDCAKRVETLDPDKFNDIITCALRWATKLCVDDAEQDAAALLASSGDMGSGEKGKQGKKGMGKSSDGKGKGMETME